MVKNVSEKNEKKVRKKKGENLAVSNNSHNFAYHLTT